MRLGIARQLVLLRLSVPPCVTLETSGRQCSLAPLTVTVPPRTVVLRVVLLA